MRQRMLRPRSASLPYRYCPRSRGAGLARPARQRTVGETRQEAERERSSLARLGRDLPPLGVPRQRTSIAVNPLTLKWRDTGRRGTGTARFAFIKAHLCCRRCRRGSGERMAASRCYARSGRKPFPSSECWGFWGIRSVENGLNFGNRRILLKTPAPFNRIASHAPMERQDRC
jgi:hypothetical protein